VKLAVELTGWAGAFLVLAAYGLLMTEKVSSTAPAYRWLNVVGSAGLIVNATWNGALPAAFLNVVWLTVTLYALARAKPAGGAGHGRA
jgi:formate hydrogenlyase subunit 3/multisubunit Na+/H+ antiporter MnhD subunit